jgi:hypothetical protein
MDVSPRFRAGLRALGALTALALLAYAGHTVFGPGSPGLDGFFRDGVYRGLVVAAGAACVLRATLVAERAAWLVMSAADVLYLSFYPASYTSLLLLARSRTDSFRSGLSGSEIPLGARVVAVCDAFDAMTTERPYRDSVSETDAIEELRRRAGTQFDPIVVDAVCKVIARERPAHGELSL